MPTPGLPEQSLQVRQHVLIPTESLVPQVFTGFSGVTSNDPLLTFPASNLDLFALSVWIGEVRVSVLEAGIFRGYLV